MKRNIKLAVTLSLVTFFSTLCFINQDNTKLFLKGLLKDPDNVGAFFPCSRFVAKEVCDYIDHSAGPLRILEIGSGCGALTKTIANQMAEGDMLDLVELQSDYCQELGRLFTNDQNISIFCGSILDWQPPYQYDVIVCSLPFNRFEPHFVVSVLEHIKSLCKPNGMLSYVELMWVTSIKKAFLTGQKKEKLAQTMSIMKQFKKAYGVRTENVYLNITPIYIHHARMPA